MKNIGKEVKVGLFAAVTLVLLYFGFNFLKGVDFFSSRKKYYAIYDNVDQLERSNKVLVSGSAVGRVSKIRLLPHRHNQVLVELEIDSDIELGDSTRAILTSEIIGGKYILLRIGPVNRILPAGDTLRTEMAKGLMDVFTETAEPVADNLQTTLRNFNLVIEHLVTNTKNLDTIFNKLKKTPDLLNRTILTANGEVVDLSASFKSVADNLNGTLNELKPTLSNFKALSDSLKQLKVNETLLKTRQMVANLNDILLKMKKKDNTLGKMMNEDSLYVNLNVVLKRLDTLVSHIDNNPKQFFKLAKNKSKIQRERQEEAAKKKAAKK